MKAPKASKIIPAYIVKKEIPETQAGRSYSDLRKVQKATANASCQKLGESISSDGAVSPGLSVHGAERNSTKIKVAASSSKSGNNGSSLTGSPAPSVATPSLAESLPPRDNDAGVVEPVAGSARTLEDILHDLSQAAGSITAAIDRMEEAVNRVKFSGPTHRVCRWELTGDARIQKR